MNKELYKEIKIKLRELQNISFKTSTLETFLRENEKNFSREESKNALNKIREYLLEMKQIQKSLETEYKELITIQSKTCNHEISIKKSTSHSYYCLICEKNLGENQNKISNLSIDVTKDYEVYYIIEKYFNELIKSDKDVFEEIIILLENLQYERNIKILRR